MLLHDVTFVRFSKLLADDSNYHHHSATQEIMNLTLNQTAYLRSAISSAADISIKWFSSHASNVSRKLFHSGNRMNDARTGAVYVYYDSEDIPLYVGQTKRGIKARLYDQTSPHKKKTWWAKWHVMRFVQLTDEMDRLTLEFLLILAYQPKWNVKPRAKAISDLFPE